MAKAFSIEDGNLQNISLTSSRQKTYRDIDLSFAKKPSGEIYKKTDAAAVKQAVKNLLLTNKYEKPFKPTFGGDLNRFLFSLGEDFDESEVSEVIAVAISNYEPRALIRDVNVDYDDASYTMNVTVLFKVSSTLEDVRVDVTLTRTR
jgi:phage baseplate assembly protein W